MDGILANETRAPASRDVESSGGVTAKRERFQILLFHFRPAGIASREKWKKRGSLLSQTDAKIWMLKGPLIEQHSSRWENFSSGGSLSKTFNETDR